jgi:hypothetical protein
MRFAFASGRETLLQYRTAPLWGALIAGQLFIRQWFDTFDPPAPTGYGPRSAVTTFAAIGTFVLIGAMEAARTGRLRTGPIVAVLAGLFGHVLGILGTAVLYFAIIAKDATRLATFDMTGGWGETIGFTFVAPLAGALLAFTGASVVRAFAFASRRFSV